MKNIDLLIVEDDKNLNHLIKKVIERNGLKAGQAFSGENIFSIINDSTPKLILLDHYLPDMNSIDIISELNQKDYHIPFIIMTGDGNENIAVDVMKLGARDYIPKKGNFIELIPEKINSVLKEIEISLEMEKNDKEIRLLSLITKQVSDSILTTDLNFNITYANDSASKLYGIATNTLLRQNLVNIFDSKISTESLSEIKEIVLKKEVWTGTFIKRRPDGTTLICENRISALFEGNAVLSFIIIQRDVTKRIKSEARREKVIMELQTALDNIKKLKGLIPICAKCKKIRDDEGYWNELELYLHEHTDADFTHGLCPDCVKELYPKAYDKLLKSGKASWNTNNKKKHKNHN